MSHPARGTKLLPVAILAALSVLAGAAVAEPIGLLSIHSDQDAAVATAVLDHAFARTGNRFLVAVSSAQCASLTGAGLEFEPILEGTEADQVYLVLSSRHPDAPQQVDIRRYGEPIDLGHGLRIMTMSQLAATSVAETSDVKVVRLTEREIRFRYLPPTVAAALPDQYPLDYLADLVNQDSIYAYDQRLQDFQTRYTFTDSCLAARDWLVQKFQGWGYSDVTIPSFWFGGAWHYNVMVVKPGVVESDKVLVIGGHYDSIVRTDQEPGRYEFAPGADDDGSGVAVTMEIARVLADIPLRKTVIFMPFGAEEVGLVGSSDAAADFAAADTKLEVMYNFDMVGYTEDETWDINLSSGDATGYLDLSIAAATRVTDLIPVVTSLGFSSDHYSFYQQGFNVVDHIESDFNYPGWHTNLDLTSRMNFPYLTEVTRMALVSLATVAEAAYPVAVETIVDIGDGQSLEVTWSDCAPDCSYRVYWGTASGVYVDSALVPPGQCGYTVGGLAEGVPYYLLAIGETPDGFRAVYGVEGTETPLLYPRVPQGVAGAASADQLQLLLSWQPNREADLSHYNVYRRVGSVGFFRLYQEGVLAASFVDDDVVAQVNYVYQVTAVDNSGYESEPSEIVSLYPASFDGGPVVVDAFTQDLYYEPDQAWQEAWLDTIFGGIDFALASADEFGGPVTLSDVGRYSSLFWMDEDQVTKNISQSETALDDFAGHNTNLLISGFKTWYDWCPKSVPSDHLLYREFRLSYYDHWGVFDFVGAHGQNGWPSIQLDADRGPNQFRDIAKLTPRTGAEVILTFDSYRDRDGWEGEPVGLAYSGPDGKRVLLSFPFYYLTPASAQALMAKVVEYFGGAGQHDKGDLDHSGTIDIVDLVLLLDHLFISLQPLADPDAADMDGRTGISIGDAYYLVDYLFGAGAPPVPSSLLPGTGTR